MSQISPPIRILLVCAVGFLGAYMLFLRPKEETVPPVETPNTQTSEPAVSKPGKIAEAAQGAVDATNGQLAKEEGVDGVDAGESAAAAKPGVKTQTKSSDAVAEAAAAGVDLAGIPKPVANAIRKDKALVLLFWNGRSADDKAVHKALAKVNRWHGRVAVQSVSIKKISKYGRIARGVDVEQSPTVVVADPDLRAETLVGYVDTQTIDQAVLDAFRNTGGIFTDAYLKKVDAACVDFAREFHAIPHYYGGASVKKSDARLDRVQDSFRDFAVAFGDIKAPKKWQGFKAATAKDLRVARAEIGQFAGTVTASSSVATVVGAESAYNAAVKPVARRMNRRFDNQGLFRCGSSF